MQKPPITELLKSRILVLDGAMGTMIQRHKFSEKDYRGERFADYPSPLQGNNDLLSLTQPEAILDIHRQYFEAGADIAETNTFSSTSVAMADYDMQELVYELNVASAQLAKKAADEYTAKTPDKPRYVAGSMGPTNKTASMSPDVNDPGYRAISFDELKAAYYEQIRGLMDGGADLLLVETVFDTLNAKAALFAIEEYKENTGRDIPVMVSGTITDASGRTLSGQTAEAFFISISHIPPVSEMMRAMPFTQVDVVLSPLSDPSQIWSAHISRVEGALDARARTVPVVVVVDDPYVGANPPSRLPLVPNMQVLISFEGEPLTDAVVLPETALHGGMVRVLGHGGLLELRPVSVALSQNGRIVIADGIEPGDIVVIDDIAPAIPGMALTAIEVHQ